MGRDLIRAVWLNEYGGPETLVAAEAPEPAAGPGQVLIEVALANVIFADTMFRAGGFGSFEAKLPTIPGNGVGGVVASVGAGVDEGLVGRWVISSTGGTGGYAERAVVGAGGLFVVPDGLRLDSAVALLADGRTATMLIRAAGLGEGERVLVEAVAWARCWSSSRGPQAPGSSRRPAVRGRSSLPVAWAPRRRCTTASWVGRDGCARPWAG